MVQGPWACILCAGGGAFKSPLGICAPRRALLGVFLLGVWPYLYDPAITEKMRFKVHKEGPQQRGLPSTRLSGYYRITGQALFLVLGPREYSGGASPGPVWDWAFLTHGFRAQARGAYPSKHAILHPPDVPLSRALWFLLDRIWGLVKGTRGGAGTISYCSPKKVYGPETLLKGHSLSLPSTSKVPPK